MSGEWDIYLSRRFETADGQLLGFVVSTIEIDYFEQFYARLPLTGGGVVHACTGATACCSRAIRTSIP